LLVCSLYFYQSMKLEYGTLSAPGPGFLPVVLGFLGTMIVAGLLIGTLMNKKRSREDASAEDAKSTASYRPLVYCIAALTALILLFEVIGVIPGLFALTILLSKICGLKGWGKPLILGAVTAMAIYTVFAIIFHIPMPHGILTGIL
jgi:hypothetical protein